MTLTVNLAPDQVERLRREATNRGMNTGTFIRQLTPQTAEFRVVGLHEGQWAITDDFDDPLPDNCWLG